MNIYIKMNESERLDVVTGHMRLKAMLQLQGYATAQDFATGKKYMVRMVGDQLQVMSDEERQSLMNELHSGPGKSKPKPTPFYRRFAKSKY